MFLLLSPTQSYTSLHVNGNLLGVLTHFIFLPECPRQGLLPCNITTAVEIDDMTCCTVDGQTSVCVSYTGVSIGSTATYTTSDNFCIDNKVLTRSCTSDMMWEDMIPTAIRGLKADRNDDVNFCLLFLMSIFFF